MPGHALPKGRSWDALCIAHLVHNTIALSFDAVLMGARIEASRAQQSQHSLTGRSPFKNMNRDTYTRLLLERKRERKKERNMGKRVAVVDRN